MCKLIDDYGEKCRESGRAEGARMIVPRLWKKGIRDYEKITEITMVPVDEVKKIIAGMSESERACSSDFWENMAREQIDTQLKSEDDTMCDLLKDYTVKHLGKELKNSYREKVVTLREVGSFCEEDISRLTKLPLDEVKKLLEEKNV